MAGPILLVLAAGMGSRYGGLKQIDRMGKRGEVLLDYSVYDALAAGFSKIVFVVRRSMEEDFRDVVLSRLEGRFEYRLAYQELESMLPEEARRRAERAGRSKPWGTAHAVLCAAEFLDAPFAAINADDFYGREAFLAMGDFLRGTDGAGALVPFRLDATVSAAGSVSRGVCRIADGLLAAVEEHGSIALEDGRIYSRLKSGERIELPGDTQVSMNFWGFHPRTLEAMAAHFRRFLEWGADEPASECYLPAAVDAAISEGVLRCRALPPAGRWFGVTHRDDRTAAVRALADLTAAGVYPSPLWSRP